MDYSRRNKSGILGFSVGTIICWLVYLSLFLLPELRRFSAEEKRTELLGLLWHLPYLLPSLIGLFVFNMTFLNNRIFYLYLVSFCIFLATYGWSLVPTGALSAGIPVVLLLWPVNLFLFIAVVDQMHRRKNRSVKGSNP